MSSIRHVGLVVLSLVVASEAVAQQRTAAPATRRPAAQTTQRPAPATVVGSWELGTDMDVGIGLGDPKSFFIDIPAGTVRAGYYVTEVLTLEPTLAFHSIARKNTTAFSTLMLQVGALYHLSPDRTKDQLFIHPAIGFTSGSGFTTRAHLSAGVGMKRPMLSGRMATRMEVALDHSLKSGTIPSQTSLIAFLGWSVYTR